MTFSHLVHWFGSRPVLMRQWDQEVSMAHTFKVELEIVVERIEGKFASRDEIADAINEALASVAEGDSLSGIGADGTSEYEIVGSTVVEVN